MQAAVGLGLANNAELLASAQRAAAAAETPIQARRLPNPQLRWTEFVEPLETRTGPHQRRIGIQQRFP